MNERYIQYVLLAGIIVVAIGLRWSSADFEYVVNYDPWWFYRHAQEIYDNNFVPPRWDSLSYFPPGRPVSYQLGWSYTLAGTYAAMEPFLQGMSLMKFSGLFVPVFASLAAIPAYFIGRMLTNGWGGLITALFAVISIKFIKLSMAGDTDTDSVVVVYSLLAVLTTIYAIKKGDKLSYTSVKTFCASLVRYLPYLIPAILAYWVFSVNWISSWYIYFIFLFFIPLLIVVRVLEGKILRREKGYASLVLEKIRQNRRVIIPIILIGLLSEPISLATAHWPYNTSPPHESLMSGLYFLGEGGPGLILIAALFVSIGAITGISLSRGVKGLLVGGALGFVITFSLISAVPAVEGLLVQKSVMELVPVDILSPTGRYIITENLGLTPLLMGILGLSGIMVFKLANKREVTAMEYFALFWVVVSLFLLDSGYRFLTLLSIAVAMAAGITAGNMVEILRGRKRAVLAGSLYSLIMVGIVMQVDVGLGVDIETARGPNTMLPAYWVETLTWLKENADEDALVLTAWGDGHTISGFTGLKVHADGAFCTSKSCVPYDLNVRLVDTGKIFTTTNEDEAVTLLRKYASLPPEECGKVKEAFDGIVPAGACNGVTEVFVITHERLVGTYSWLSYYATYDRETESADPWEFTVLKLTDTDENGNLLYDDGFVTIERRGDQLVPFLLIDGDNGAEPTRTKISEIVFYDDDGGEKRLKFTSTDEEEARRGLVWMSPEKTHVIVVDELTRDALLAKLFFFQGADLEHFELVFDNPKAKIYKVRL